MQLGEFTARTVNWLLLALTAAMVGNHIVWGVYQQYRLLELSSNNENILDQMSRGVVVVIIFIMITLFIWFLGAYNFFKKETSKSNSYLFAAFVLLGFVGFLTVGSFGH